MRRGSSPADVPYLWSPFPIKIILSQRLSCPTETNRFHFEKPENYMTVYHKQGTDVLFVGGQAVIYMLTFTDKGVRDTKVGGDLVTLCQDTAVSLP